LEFWLKVDGEPLVGIEFDIIGGGDASDFDTVFVNDVNIE
jgi:hypothetical protein